MANPYSGVAMMAGDLAQAISDTLGGLNKGMDEASNLRSQRLQQEQQIQQILKQRQEDEALRQLFGPDFARRFSPIRETAPTTQFIRPTRVAPPVGVTPPANSPTYPNQREVPTAPLPPATALGYEQPQIGEGMAVSGSMPSPSVPFDLWRSRPELGTYPGSGVQLAPLLPFLDPRGAPKPEVFLSNAAQRDLPDTALRKTAEPRAEPVSISTPEGIAEAIKPSASGRMDVIEQPGGPPGPTGRFLPPRLEQVLRGLTNPMARKWAVEAWAKAYGSPMDVELIYETSKLNPNDPEYHEKMARLFARFDPEKYLKIRPSAAELKTAAQEREWARVGPGMTAAARPLMESPHVSPEMKSYLQGALASEDPKKIATAMALAEKSRLEGAKQTETHRRHLALEAQAVEKHQAWVAAQNQRAQLAVQRLQQGDQKAFEAHMRGVRAERNNAEAEAARAHASLLREQAKEKPDSEQIAKFTVAEDMARQQAAYLGEQLNIFQQDKYGVGFAVPGSPGHTGPPPVTPVPQTPPGKIRVRRKSDGAPGTIDAKDYDPSRYDRIQ